MNIDWNDQLIRSRFHSRRLRSWCTLLLLISLHSMMASSCMNAEKDKEKEAGSPDLTKIAGPEPTLMNADSIVIIVYDDSVDDSLRYSRYYQFTSTSDIVVLGMLAEHWKQQPIVTDNLRPCRSEGKLQLYMKGDPVKTVYYADKDGGCKYLYFISDGLFYYFDIGNELSKYLAEVRKKQQVTLKK